MPDFRVEFEGNIPEAEADVDEPIKLKLVMTVSAENERLAKRKALMALNAFTVSGPNMSVCRIWGGDEW